MLTSYARIIKHGTSLGVILTKEIRELGLEYGDWVQITIEPLPKNPKSKVTEITPSDEVTDVTINYVRPPQEKPTTVREIQNESNDPTDNNGDYDPSKIGTIIIRTQTSFDEDSLRKAIGQYKLTPEQSDAVLEYIKEAKEL